MDFQFSEDFKYIYIKQKDGSVTALLWSDFSPAEKREIYEQKAMETYA
jgi:hypothetical protein